MYVYGVWEYAVWNFEDLAIDQRTALHCAALLHCIVRSSTRFACALIGMSPYDLPTLWSCRSYMYVCIQWVSVENTETVVRQVAGLDTLSV